MSVRGHVIRLLRGDKFARNVAVLAGGTLAARAIIVVAAPLLTRLYSPEQFGLLAVYAALLASIGVIASFRFHIAIPLPKDENEAAQVTVLSLICITASVLVTTFVVVTLNDEIATAFNIPEFATYVWLIPAGVGFIAVYQVFNYWAIRSRSFKDIARTRILQAVSMVAIQIGGYTFGPISLLVGQAAGQGAGAGHLAWRAARTHSSHFRNVTFGDLRTVARRYKRFPIFSTWSALLNTVGVYLPSLLLASLFNSAAAGLYALTHRVLSMPMHLIGRAVADVFFSRAAEKHRVGAISPLVVSVHHGLANLAMPLALLLGISGPQMFALTFGEDWRSAGAFAQWMAPWLYLVFVASPLSTLFAVLEKQAQGLIFQGTLFGVRCVTLILGALKGDVVLAIALYSIGSAACWLAFLIWAFKLSGSSLAELYRSSLHAFAWATILVSPLVLAIIVNASLTSQVVGLIGAIALISIRYVMFVRAKW